jgi:hypothetical protein
MARTVRHVSLLEKTFYLDAVCYVAVQLSAPRPARSRLRRTALQNLGHLRHHQTPKVTIRLLWSS